MSYDIKLSDFCNHRILEEDHIFEDDELTVVLDKFTSNSNLIVRINDFERKTDFKTEILIHETVIPTGSIIHVLSYPIYDGLKIGNISKYTSDVIVKNKIIAEDVSNQFTGSQSAFKTSNKPLLNSGAYDYTQIVDNNDLDIKIMNGIIDVTNMFIVIDIDVTNGKIQFDKVIPAGYTVTVTYYYRVFVKAIDGLNGILTLNSSLTGLVSVQYYHQVSDGWFLQKSQKSLIPSARDVEFYLPQKTNRVHVVYEDVSNQFISNVKGNFVYTSVAGSETQFQLKDRYIVSGSYTVTVDSKTLVEGIDFSIDLIRGIITLFVGLIIGQVFSIEYDYRSSTVLWFMTVNSPLLPLFQNFYNSPINALNNAVVVTKVYDVVNETILRRRSSEYQLVNTPILSNSYRLYKNGNLLIDQTDYEIDLDSGIINFKFIITPADVLIANYQYGVNLPVATINPLTGYVKLFDYPKVYDKIVVSYYYQTQEIPDRISVDYTVPTDQCAKCITHSSLIDYRTDGVGNYFKVWREEKLIQDLLKITETILGSDPVALWYGMTLIKMIGAKLFPDYIQTKISSQILDALNNLKTAQIQQGNYQEVDPQEAIDFIKNLTVQQNVSQPSYYQAFVDIVTQAGNSIDNVSLNIVSSTQK
jgi:hypothetical protein